MHTTQPTVSTCRSAGDGLVTIELVFPVTRLEFVARAGGVMESHEHFQDPQASRPAGSAIEPMGGTKIEQVAATNRLQLLNFTINRPAPRRWQG